MPAACLSVACPAPAPRLHPPAVAARARARARVVGGSGRGAVPALGEAAPDAIVWRDARFAGKKTKAVAKKGKGSGWQVLVRAPPPSALACWP
jgi:hypothetical protein